MVGVGRTVNTSKRLAAGRQIQAAIRHYNDGHFECAITLAHAAENMIAKPPPGLPGLFEKLKRAMADIDHNAVANWLKHPSGANDTVISELDVKVGIQRAISKFHARFDAVTDSMKAFQDKEREKLQGEKIT